MLLIVLAGKTLAVIDSLNFAKREIHYKRYVPPARQQLPDAFRTDLGDYERVSNTVQTRFPHRDTFLHPLRSRRSIADKGRDGILAAQYVKD